MATMNDRPVTVLSADVNFGLFLHTAKFFVGITTNNDITNPDVKDDVRR